MPRELFDFHGQPASITQCEIGKVDFGTGTGRKASFNFFFPAWILDPPLPPVHMFYGKKKANSKVPAIFFLIARLLQRKGGTGTGIHFSFPCEKPSAHLSRKFSHPVMPKMLF